MRIFLRNRDLMNGMDGRWAVFTKPFLKAFHALNRNSKEGSARNISAHYDLGNDLYELMLDETMMYSCAIYPRPEATLHEAQVAKLDAICQKLALTPQDHLVEIGTGWGGLAIHAATNYGCRVTTTTISREQHDYAKAKIEKLGLANRITLLFQDYRDLDGQYDKLVSIEMIEAVGADFLETYLAKCSSLLEAQRHRCCCRRSRIQDQFYERALGPGGLHPALHLPGQLHPVDHGHYHSRHAKRQTSRCLTSKTSDRTTRPHSVTGANVSSRTCPPCASSGLNDSFVRMWEFYLCYCEGGFMERALGDVHILLSKPGARREPITALLSRGSG